MHLVPTSSTSTPVRVLPFTGACRGGSANDSGFFAAQTRTHHVNTLVAGLVGRVAARMQSKSLNIALRLAPGDPWVNSNPGELSFVLGAVLGAALRIVEEERGEYVGVHVSAARSKVRIAITSDGVPPLRFVRALDPRGTDGDVDPTLAHCRRLIEARGGALVLTEEDGRLGFALELPSAVLSPAIRLLPTLCNDSCFHEAA
jgi:C4-dicarboxylate-specific signal transduction histidine kinase